MAEITGLALDFEAPADDLKNLISSYYWFRSPPLPGPQVERADRAQFRFVLRGKGGYEFCDGTYLESAPSTIIGPTTGPTVGRVDGEIEIFGAGLQPAAWGMLMGGDSEKYTNRLLDAEALFGAAVREIHGEIAAAETLEAKVATADLFFRTILDTGEEAPFWFTRIVDEWLTGSASPEVADLVDKVGMSGRQVERMMKRYYGAPPKVIARKYRALKASSDFLREEGGAADAFYDQSHLTRELKQFIGLTPGKARDALPELNRTILERRRLLAGKVDKLISDT